MDLETQCSICFCSIELENCTVINCGHMYHFDCLQNSYAYDHERGKRSQCAICREHIKSPPIRIYGAAGFPKESISYKIEKEVLGPNIEGKRRHSQSQTNTPINEVNAATIEFYENRMADLEVMLEEYEGIDDQVDELETDLEETQALLERTRQELDGRNIEMAAISARLFESEKKTKLLECEVEAAKKELEAFKYIRASTEVQRLANEISRLQSDSYYKNLSKDPEIRKEEIILILAGMTTQFQNMKLERDQLEKEVRMHRIYKEKIEKLERMQKTNNSNVIYKENKDVEILIDDDETDLEIEPNVQSVVYSPINPFRITANPAPTSSRMVPKTIPKGLKLSGASASTGTGKKSKVIDMPGGKKYFV